MNHLIAAAAAGSTACSKALTVPRALRARYYRHCLMDKETEAQRNWGACKSNWSWGRVQVQGLAVQTFRGSLTFSGPQIPHQ